MSILMAIWNGPFHIGKLTRPVSVGDVLLKFLEVLWRTVVAIVGIGLAVTLGIAGYYYVISPVLFPPIKDKISVSAFYAANLREPPPLVTTVAPNGEPLLPSMEDILKEPCSKEFPIRISAINNSNETLASMGFDLKGYAPGSSADFVENWGYQTSDTILLPKRGWSNCYAVTTRGGMDPSKLRYEVEVWSAQALEE
jgi:hypothetical protein